MEAIQRLFQKSNLIHADETLVTGATVADLDLEYFKDYFQKRFGKNLDDETLPIPKILENMNLLKENSLTVSGTLLFANTPQYKLPAFIVKAGAFDSNDLSTTQYNDSRDITGKLADVYQQTVYFVLSNLRHVQETQYWHRLQIMYCHLEVMVPVLLGLWQNTLTLIFLMIGMEICSR